MLGFSPVASRPISGGSFGLVSVPAALAATATIVFGIGGNPGAYSPMSATVAIAFAVEANWIAQQSLSATATIVFGGTPRLFVAGKPIVINAVPQSFTLNARQDSYTLKAVPESFTIRGVR